MCTNCEWWCAHAILLSSQRAHRHRHRHTLSLSRIVSAASCQSTYTSLLFIVDVVRCCHLHVGQRKTCVYLSYPSERFVLRVGKLGLSLDLVETTTAVPQPFIEVKECADEGNVTCSLSSSLRAQRRSCAHRHRHWRHTCCPESAAIVCTNIAFLTRQTLNQPLDLPLGYRLTLPSSHPQPGTWQLLALSASQPHPVRPCTHTHTHTHTHVVRLRSDLLTPNARA
jgi:hypothetical protein